jgi:hypothetical protein
VAATDKGSRHHHRGTGTTTYLENGGTLEKARQLAAHASTLITQLYDRREDRVTLDEVVTLSDDAYAACSSPALSLQE